MHRRRGGRQTTAAEKSLEFVREHTVIGLGTGRAATAFVRALGKRVRDGFHIRGVPTSQATADLAADLGIPLVSLGDVQQLHTTFDGADEVDPQLQLIKGYGGALVREKIVAASSDRLVILVGPEKLVPALGSRHVLPVEVVPFAEPLCQRRLRALGCDPTLRQSGGVAFVTDNGNHILDCGIQPIANPADLERSILAIPGVLGTGLFLDMADIVIVDRDSGAEVLRRRG